MGQRGGGLAVRSQFSQHTKRVIAATDTNVAMSERVAVASRTLN
eukprot:CAMPEP_0174836476 /NCGR_PEP_ID=MMETSP1114-20130205/6105_1 /TAXON_ID=312471 /ORGANISM="Neobodo designis, Strain CCAP 1951/1" /LENGTH=43 /DNA_ID= /DNA_START= /DNA_END= /DNA_ORIENTATION=